MTPARAAAILRNTTSALTRRGLAGELTTVHGIDIRNTSLGRKRRVSVWLSIPRLHYGGSGG